MVISRQNPIAALLVLMFICSTGLAQGDLKSQVSALAQNIQPVQSRSKTYEQGITFVDPAVVRYSYDEIDQKGNKTNYVFEFNLADIDPYTVREQTQKDIINVGVSVRNKQKLVKTYKNETVQPYDAEVLIRAKDIDNARAISEIIKKAIPLAEKVMSDRLKLSGYAAMTDWVVKNVRDVELGDKTVVQSVKKGDAPGTMIYTRTEKDAKSTTEEIYTYNLGDINPNAVTYKITGNQFAISLEIMQKSKYVSVRKDGQLRPYVSGFVIATNNADEARDLRNVLGAAIPLAEKAVKDAMPTASTEKEGLNKLAALTTTVKDGEKEIVQTLAPACLTTLSQVEKTAKASVKNEFKFNWMDVTPLGTSMEVSGDVTFIEIHFEGQKKLAMHNADDGFKGYDNEVRLYMPDIESARRARVLVDLLAKKCTDTYKLPFGTDAAGTTAYVRSNVKELTVDDVTLKQSIEPVEAGNNKFKFTVVEITPKGSGSEQVFEFNLSDMDAGSITTDVKGKWLYVVMESNMKNKIIKAYKDGKIQPYTHTVSFAINDVDVARNLVAALTRAVKAIKK